jgi:hypothetical protein
MNTVEDFAESFKYFIKHKGKLPEKWQQRPGIVQRWKRLRRPGRFRSSD